jgi:hypothetical protein
LAALIDDCDVIVVLSAVHDIECGIMRID